MERSGTGAEGEKPGVTREAVKGGGKMEQKPIDAQKHYCISSIWNPAYVSTVEYLKQVFALRRMAEVNAAPPDTESVSWGMIDATGQFLFDALTPDGKCRIVIEYDPAEEKTIIFREEFDGPMSDISEFIKRNAGWQGE